MSAKGVKQPLKSLTKYFPSHTNSKHMQYNTYNHNNLHRKVFRAWTIRVVTKL